jgi:hypothetical protein
MSNEVLIAIVAINAVVTLSLWRMTATKANRPAGLHKKATGGRLGCRRTPPGGVEGIGRLGLWPEPKVCTGCAQVLWTPVYVIDYMLAILGPAKGHDHRAPRSGGAFTRHVAL